MHMSLDTARRRHVVEFQGLGLRIGATSRVLHLGAEAAADDEDEDGHERQHAPG